MPAIWQLRVRTRYSSYVMGSIKLRKKEKISDWSQYGFKLNHQCHCFHWGILLTKQKDLQHRSYSIFLNTGGAESTQVLVLQERRFVASDLTKCPTLIALWCWFRPSEIHICRSSKYLTAALETLQDCSGKPDGFHYLEWLLERDGKLHPRYISNSFKPNGQWKPGCNNSNACNAFSFLQMLILQ